MTGRNINQRDIYYQKGLIIYVSFSIIWNILDF